MGQRALFGRAGPNIIILFSCAEPNSLTLFGLAQSNIKSLFGRDPSNRELMFVRDQPNILFFVQWLPTEQRITVFAEILVRLISAERISYVRWYTAEHMLFVRRSRAKQRRNLFHKIYLLSDFNW